METDSHGNGNLECEQALQPHKAESEQVARGEQQVMDRQTRIMLVANWD